MTVGPLGGMARSAAEFLSIIEQENEEPSADVELVLDSYVRHRGDVAKEMRAMAEMAFAGGASGLMATCIELGDFMSTVLGDVVDAKYLGTPKPGPTHQVLFAYLAAHLGVPVAAVRLKAISGEQTHCERRVRELRDFGYVVQASSSAGQNSYALSPQEPDILVVARGILRRRLLEDTSLSEAERDEIQLAAETRLISVSHVQGVLEEHAGD